MHRQLVTLDNDTGLHVRPATLFMEAASRFDSVIRVTKDGQVADGKSAISLMLLEASRGVQLTIEAEGTDEVAAVGALVALIERRFDDRSPSSEVQS
jgi:phosphotransferase system HPr (HPr) family protein